MGVLSSSIIHLFLILQLQTLFVLSQNIVNGSVPVGESLTASESQQFSSSWRSPSGDFAFGFRKIQQNDGFTLSIWFDKISDKTIVWHAQVNTSTGLVPAGSKVTLTAGGGLVLVDHQGLQLWNSSLSPSSGSVYRGRMTDAGNFILSSEDSGVDLWTSFANPTDTLLPTQSIQVGGSLASRRTEANFTKGRFRLRLGDDGNLQLAVLNSNTDANFNYYESDTKDPNPGTRLVFNESGYMYVLQTYNSTRFLVNTKDPVSSRDYYQRVVLLFDGVLSQYYHPKRQGSNGTGWLLSWALPENICQRSSSLGNMACGYNNICSLGDDQRPKCQCPERFSLMDPEDAYGDCVPDFQMQTCGPEKNKTANANANADVNLYELIPLDRTNFPSGDYEKYENYDEERCKKACLNDCFCAAVVFGLDGVCWKKKFPLSFGQRAAIGNIDDTRNSYTLLKVLTSAADVQSPEAKGKISTG
ncbi:unnamed protein product [Microthlaspi erraticum]|uniref:Bulb-type lectin domain-containing protein n=1 Tax=Microthlaspi erraticum TaxID=1685480 RepID=A0A6D2IKV6_9BRAS|nr:unnamed protein product [Microthlaspi erraticum]